MKRYVFISFVIFIISTLLACSMASIRVDAVLPDLLGKPDGVYRGSFSASGIPVKVELDVTIQNEQLSLIKIIKHDCSPIGKQAEKIVDRIIAKQSLDVDVVSGATASSKAILKAVENALQ